MGMLMLSFWLKENAPGRRRIVIIGLVMLLTAVVLNQLGQALIPVNGPAQHWLLPTLTASANCSLFPRKMPHEIAFPAITAWCCLFFGIHVALFRQSCRSYRPYYFCGFCVSQSNDWRTLVYWHHCRFDDRDIDRFALGVADAIKWSINHLFDKSLPGKTNISKTNNSQ